MSKYKVNWLNHQDILDWKEIAEEKQKFYCACLGKSKWEIYEADDLHYLKLKIGYSLFGPTQNLKRNDIDSIYIDPNYKIKIDSIMSAIGKHKNNALCLSFIYFITIMDNEYSEFPVIRVLHKKEEVDDVCFFVDTLGNSYKSWEEFLYTNVTPKCIYCYPRNGKYTSNGLGHVALDYSYSPQTYSIIFKGIGSISSTVGAVTSVLSESKAKVVSGVTGRNCWVKVASVENCSTSYAIHSTNEVAGKLEEFDRINPFLAKAIRETTPIRPNWFAVLNWMVEILQPTDIITTTHIAQLFVTILFFCNTVVSYDTCKEILEKTLNGIPNKVKIDDDNRTKNYISEMVDKILTENSDETIHLIKRIENTADLYEEILSKNKSLENGNFSIENMSEIVKVVSKDDIILMQKMVSYCFYLEEVTKNCKNCSEKVKKAKNNLLETDELSNKETSKLKDIELKLIKGGGYLASEIVKHVFDKVLESTIEWTISALINFV